MGIKQYSFKRFRAVFAYYSNIIMTSNYAKYFCKRLIFRMLQSVFYGHFA